MDLIEIIDRVLYNLLEVHPIHTLVVHFPIALTGAALFFLLLSLWRRNSMLEYVAFANIALASISTAAAGLTGLMDNAEIYGGQAPNASTKIVLAIVLLIITATTAFFRWRNSQLLHSRARALYIGAYVISFLLASVLGFLGGVILYGF
ncbi:MAG: hypothetical protein JSV37_12970 [Anaerolineaceae bacterium]|nr:MAG: hypothetical protein JSV37_12970 [Anaerolineaceae bacterium]